ncbi:MAG: amino acid permease [Acidobacteriia bacterium]|nr:amino acid permease [Terriglobia bacterium]
MIGPEAPSEDLRRQLGLVDAAAIYVGIVLGSGIFVAPAAIAGIAPGAAAAAAFWLVGGGIAACGAFCYAECGARLPRTGGFYVFYREAFGAPLAFVGGWAAVLVTYPASIAAIALVLARYFGEVIPLRGMEVPVAASALVAAGALNALGVRVGAGAQRALTGVKLAALALLCAAALLAGTPAPPSPSPIGLGVRPAALLAALVVMLWTYDGWSDVTLVSGELKRPGRDLGRAVLLGTAVLAVLYVLVQLSVGALLDPAHASSSERVVAEAVEAGIGARAGRLVAVLVVVCTFGSINGTVLTASRLGFAMARDGRFPSWFGRVHPRFNTPARSVAGLVVAALLYVVSAGFGNLLAFFSFSVWIFYGLTAAALVVLRRRGVGEPVSWRAPLGPLPPAVVLVTSLGMTASLMYDDPTRSLAGLGLLLLGFPAYALWKRYGTGRL